MFVVGSDSCTGHKNRFKKLFETGTELIVVKRDKDNSNWKDKCKNSLDSDLNADSERLVHFFDSNDNHQIRSTQIIKILKGEEKEDLAKLLHPKVLEYIEKHKFLREEEQFEFKEIQLTDKNIKTN